MIWRACGGGNQRSLIGYACGNRNENLSADTSSKTLVGHTFVLLEAIPLVMVEMLNAQDRSVAVKGTAHLMFNN